MSSIGSVVAGLLILSVVFWLVERWRPSLPAQRRTRTDTLTDVGYWFFTPHTSEEEGLDKNFSGLFPFIDLAFGTFYMPPDRQPQHFGLVHDDVPSGLVRQLVYPFKQS